MTATDPWLTHSLSPSLSLSLSLLPFMGRMCVGHSVSLSITSHAWWPAWRLRVWTPSALVLVCRACLSTFLLTFYCATSCITVYPFSRQCSAANIHSLDVRITALCELSCTSIYA
jgi:hypothetical protein